LILPAAWYFLDILAYRCGKKAANFAQCAALAAASLVKLAKAEIVSSDRSLSPIFWRPSNPSP